MTTVTLTLTEDQAYTLWDALETYNRLLMGQFQAVTALFPGGHYGIRNLEAGEQARVAFDIQQVLRHALAWHRYPGGGIGVCYDNPYKTSREPLIRVEIQD